MSEKSIEDKLILYEKHIKHIKKGYLEQKEQMTQINPFVVSNLRFSLFFIHFLQTLQSTHWISSIYLLQQNSNEQSPAPLFL